MAVGLRVARARISRKRKSRRGQSLVEFTLMLPILLIMLSGLVEFGFLLNTYLDVIDAARDAARAAANVDPTAGLPSESAPNFWNDAWRHSRHALFQASDGRIDWTPSDWSNCDPDVVKGDIVVSAFGIFEDSVQTRYPAGYIDGASNCSPPAPWGTGTYHSKFQNEDIDDLLDLGSIDNSGVVLVEIYYEYEWLLGLPWITAFMPPDGIVLYAYTIMPNTFAQPEP